MDKHDRIAFITESTGREKAMLIKPLKKCSMRQLSTVMRLIGLRLIRNANIPKVRR